MRVLSKLRQAFGNEKVKSLPHNRAIFIGVFIATGGATTSIEVYYLWMGQKTVTSFLLDSLLFTAIAGILLLVAYYLVGRVLSVYTERYGIVERAAVRVVNRISSVFKGGAVDHSNREWKGNRSIVERGSFPCQEGGSALDLVTARSKNGESRFKETERVLPAFLAALFLVFTMVLIPTPALAQGLNWRQANQDGFGVAAPEENREVYTMAVCDGQLYAGTWNEDDGCGVWRYDWGTDWTRVTNNGFGTVEHARNQRVLALTEYNRRLYAATQNGHDGCGVWRYDGDTTWIQVNKNGFGIAVPSNNWGAQALAVLDGELYASTSNSAEGCQVWRYDGDTTWTQVNANGFGIAVPTNNQQIISMAVFDAELYASTSNPADGCQVWRYDGGTDWTQVNAAGFGIAVPAQNSSIHNMAVYEGKLYASSDNETGGCQVWRYDEGTDWTKVNKNGFGIAVPKNNGDSWCMAVYDGDLYAGACNAVDGCGIWRYEGGIDWTQVNEGGFGIAAPTNNLGAHSMIEYKDGLYVGTANLIDGCQVWAGKSPGAITWYLAEGSTGANAQGAFESWVLVQNPGDTKAEVDLFYQTPSGEKPGPHLSMQAHTRSTVNIADTVPNEFSVSTRVVSNNPVIAERAMYWNTPGAFRQAATDSIGVPGPAATWYLAEGSTGATDEGAFESWVLVQNPGDAKAEVDLFYQTPTGEKPGPHLSMQPHTRSTVNIADTVPNEFSVSTRVVADNPVIAERAMYWNTPGQFRQAATDSIGFDP